MRFQRIKTFDRKFELKYRFSSYMVFWLVNSTYARNLFLQIKQITDLAAKLL